MREAVYKRFWVIAYHPPGAVGSPCNPSKLFLTRPLFSSTYVSFNNFFCKSAEISVYMTESSHQSGTHSRLLHPSTKSRMAAPVLVGLVGTCMWGLSQLNANQTIQYNTLLHSNTLQDLTIQSIVVGAPHEPRFARFAGTKVSQKGKANSDIPCLTLTFKPIHTPTHRQLSDSS